jgi:hypothetical protein
MAARCLTTGDAIAPANAPVGSASARPVATAYRNTWPIVARSRFAVSSFPRDSHEMEDASLGANKNYPNDWYPDEYLRKYFVGETAPDCSPSEHGAGQMRIAVIDAAYAMIAAIVAHWR